MRSGTVGRVLVRDYASGDLAQERFAAKDRQRLAENFYVRGDGTRAYYFTASSIRTLFSDQEMLLEELAVHERAITNRGKGVTMDRRWVQASFASAQVTGWGVADVTRHVDQMGLADIARHGVRCYLV
jgi:methyltransferase-like protein 6